MKVSFILFIIGMAIAVGSLLTNFFLLYHSLYNQSTIVFESNPFIALIEMTLILLAVGTCVVATEIYHKYLKFEAMLLPEQRKEAKL